MECCSVLKDTKGKKIVSEKFAVKYGRETVQSLQKLGFEKESKAVSLIDFAKFKTLNLNKLNQVILKTFTDVHSEENSKIRGLKTTKSVQEVARIIYLWNVLASNDKRDLDMRSFVTLDPLENMIAINSLIRGKWAFHCLHTFLVQSPKKIIFPAFDINLESLDPEIVWSFLVHSSQNFPLGTQIHLLQKVGLTKEEIRDYTLNGQANLSNKTLPISNPNFIPLMKTQLSTLRLQNKSKQIVDLMKDLLKHDFKNSHRKDLVTYSNSRRDKHKRKKS